MNSREIFFTILVLSILLYTSIILFSFRRRDFRFAGRLALSIGLSLVPIALLFGLGIRLIEQVRPASGNLSSFLIVILLSFIAVGIFYITWKNAPKLVNLFFSHSIYDSNQLLRDYSQAISGVTTTEQLAQVSISLICQALKVDHGILLEVFSDQETAEPMFHLVGIGGMGTEKPTELVLDSKAPLIQFFKQSRQPLSLKELELVPGQFPLSTIENIWVHSLSCEIFIPIHTHDDWIGVIALGPKTSKRTYLKEELILVSTLADQLSLALKNARLVDSLTRLNNDFRRAYQSMEQSNRQLQQALNQLQKIDQTKSDFISVASHELLTPVTIMRGYTEILLDEPALTGNDYHQKMLNGIHLGIMRLSEIIETMLDMASIDARALSLSKTNVSLGYLIQSLAKSLTLSMSQRNISLTMEGLSDLPIIQADQDALRKVFNHLIQNAYQNTPDNGKISISGLSISPGQTNLPDGGVEIIISDTGIGIQREHLDLIFTKFYQTSDSQHHSSGKSKFKGSGPGLGLAIAKGIVEAHGGKIWAESPGFDEEKCPGSQFHVILPV